MNAWTTIDHPPFFNALEIKDWVTYDFQYKDLSHVFDITSDKLLQVFPKEQITSQAFCSGFYGSKRNNFGPEEIDFFLEKLSQGEAEILYPQAPDQTILNYFVMRKPINSSNLALTLTADKITGNSVTSTHFESKDGIVFDKDNRLLYLHYIGIPSKAFTRVCKGENVDFSYRDVFLHYRYLHNPENRPNFTGSKLSYRPQPPSLTKKLLRKLKLSK
jgi:hypothetical protein